MQESRWQASLTLNHPIGDFERYSLLQNLERSDPIQALPNMDLTAHLLPKSV